MTDKPPLHIHLLAHPESKEAKRVAEALMTHFVEPPASGGLRIPVFFTPDRGDGLPPGLDEGSGLNLDAAEHTIVVILVDARMLRTVRPTDTGTQWRAFAAKLFKQAPLGSSPHHVLPVALDERSFKLTSERHVLPALLESDADDPQAQARRLADISLHISARALQLLKANRIEELAPDEIKAPVRLFISHAKADLSRDKQDPAYQTMQALVDLPIEHWFDAKQIATSQKFEEAITAGIRDCSIMVAFHTDHYGSRPWCRREVLDAKRLGAHLLLVNALKEGEPRQFPYLGNVPVVRWQFTDPAVDARRVVNRAVLEALRVTYNRVRLERLRGPEEVVLAVPPEPLTLAYAYDDPQREKTFLYPDPPLSREELEVLEKLRPRGHFVTPLTRIAQWKRPSTVDMVTVSISASNDPERYGFSAAHQDTLSDEIHLYLLLAGLRIAYGGALNANFGDASNFTLRLFELVRSYAGLAQALKTERFHPIVNFAPWPLRLAYGDEEFNLFDGDVAEYREGPRPDLPWKDEVIFPEQALGWRLLPDSAEKRYAWARGLTSMRERITAESQARVVIGGDLRKFQGIVSGVVEEAWMSLDQQKPLYLVGAFGGAARAVGDMLTGIDRREFALEDAEENVPDYHESVACFAKYGGEFHGMDAMGEDMRHLRQDGLAAALCNGLDEAENHALIQASNPERIAALILTGLSRLPG